MAFALRHPAKATAKVSQRLHAPTAPAAAPRSQPSTGPDRRQIFAEIQGALNDRMLDRPRAPRSLGMRFPEVPSGAYGRAISREPGQRDWTEMIEGLDVPRAGRMLDFGCGASDRRSLAGPLGVAWFGLDVPFSMESTAREDRSAVTFYGGVGVPFADDSFDLVVSIQVFEHVPEPHTTFAEIARITRSGGYLVGSTSFNEPFHSESTFGYSPKNFARMIGAAGFELLEVTPGIDMWTLAIRRLTRQFRHNEAATVIDPFFGTTPSPLNDLIDECATQQQVEPARANALKLELAGQFNFLARKR